MTGNFNQTLICITKAEMFFKKETMADYWGCPYGRIHLFHLTHVHYSFQPKQLTNERSVFDFLILLLKITFLDRILVIVPTTGVLLNQWDLH